jgi:hypothetical protein
MSRSVENLNKCFDHEKTEAIEELRAFLDASSCLAISGSDTETTLHKRIFARKFRRGWSTLEGSSKGLNEGASSDRSSVADVPRIKKVSGYLKELVNYSSKV